MPLIWISLVLTEVSFLTMSVFPPLPPSAPVNPATHGSLSHIESHPKQWLPVANIAVSHSFCGAGIQKGLGWVVLAWALS